METAANNTPWVTLPRKAWAELAHSSNLWLDDETITRLRGIQDPTDKSDVEEVYLPLTQLIDLYRHNTGQLFSDSNAFLKVYPNQTPFVIGVAGSVAVGKSTTARLLAELLRRTVDRPNVALVTTDGFLYPNAVLKERGLYDRKGFPESYDRRALVRFVVAVKSGNPRVLAPLYSHITYDIVPDEKIVVERPDILIIEGLNVLQPAPIRHNGQTLAVSDFFDFSVYVDADEDSIRQWYVKRFLVFREGAFRDPKSYFRHYAELGDDEAVALANKVWDDINGKNLRENIAPSKDRATAILRKDADHSVRDIRIRKI